MDKKQINLRLEPELYDFLIQYSKKNYKTVTGVVREMVVDLYRESKALPIVVDNVKK